MSMRSALLICCSFLLFRLMAAEVEYFPLPNGGIAPTMCTDAQGTVHLLYFMGDPKAGDMYYMRREKSAKSFTKPIQVNSSAKTAMVIGYTRGPDMAVSSAGDVHVSWLSVGPSGGAVYYAHKPNKKKSFSKQRAVSGATDGFDAGLSIAANGDQVAVIWPAHGSGNSEQQRLLYAAWSQNGGDAFAKPIPLNAATPGICACCDIDAGFNAAGELQVLYRNASNSGRHATLLSQAKDAFVVTEIDTWLVNQCPMSTFHVEGANPNSLMVWQTKNQILWSQIGAQKKHTASGKGKNRKHPVIVANKDGVLCLAFSEGTGWNRGGSVECQVMSADGVLLAAQRFDGLKPWSTPALVVQANGNFLITY